MTCTCPQTYRLSTQSPRSNARSILTIANDQNTCTDHRLEEAETNLVAKQEANALLNSQVDVLTKQLLELQAGKAAYEKHFKDLSTLLAKERRQHAPDSKQVLLASCTVVSVSSSMQQHERWAGCLQEHQNGELLPEPPIDDPAELELANAGWPACNFSMQHAT